MDKDIEWIDQIGRAMQAAWIRVKKAQSRLWSEWMVIGDGLLEGRRWAMQQANVNHPEGRGYVTAFAEWLKRYKVDDMDKSDRAKLLQIMEERLAVEEWRATLTDHERRNLNNPVIVWRKWTAATRVKKPKPRTAATDTERVREQQAARSVEVEEELEGARSLLLDALVTLENCFRSLGSSQADIKAALSTNLYKWRAAHRKEIEAGAKAATETSNKDGELAKAVSEVLSVLPKARAPKTAGTLVWKTSAVYVHTADLPKRGRITIMPMFDDIDFKTKTAEFLGYEIYINWAGGARRDFIKRGVQAIEEAQALAQAYYDKNRRAVTGLSFPKIDPRPA
jgi:hypothetical protein